MSLSDLATVRERPAGRRLTGGEARGLCNRARPAMQEQRESLLAVGIPTCCKPELGAGGNAPARCTEAALPHTQGPPAAAPELKRVAQTVIITPEAAGGGCQALLGGTTPTSPSSFIDLCSDDDDDGPTSLPTRAAASSIIDLCGSDSDGDEQQQQPQQRRLPVRGKGAAPRPQCGAGWQGRPAAVKQELGVLLPLAAAGRRPLSSGAAATDPQPGSSHAAAACGGSGGTATAAQMDSDLISGCPGAAQPSCSSVTSASEGGSEEARGEEHSACQQLPKPLGGSARVQPQGMDVEEAPAATVSASPAVSAGSVGDGVAVEAAGAASDPEMVPLCEQPPEQPVSGRMPGSPQAARGAGGQPGSSARSAVDQAAGGDAAHGRPSFPSSLAADAVADQGGSVGAAVVAIMGEIVQACETITSPAGAGLQKLQPEHLPAGSLKRRRSGLEAADAVAAAGPEAGEASTSAARAQGRAAPAEAGGGDAAEDDGMLDPADAGAMLSWLRARIPPTVLEQYREPHQVRGEGRLSALGRALCVCVCDQQGRPAVLLKCRAPSPSFLPPLGWHR